ncbi:peptide-methionine (R)-S-oxide reductase [Amylibacter marinus]|uniref:peptide-methionine (R)-S-oxide reductase n=1 Tax=Amylibacter marinus TaxID=1475483 RepID=A0ABQ5VYN9_9RHOB|nr:peptide-methionine (R)-S-oxide reductase MsrB [Amylibacter marinus]GLQ36317.1 peptide-methionine (R)-S-oxide reductase [Amylibacter marinus]
MKRREFIYLGSAAVFSSGASAVSAGTFEITRSPAQWRKMLSEAEYLVMREEKTERKFSSPLNTEKRDGLYHCRGCDLALYSSDKKYDSKTGWPSFWDVLDNAIRTKNDDTLFTRRTECHCRRCGSHLGHIFNDGPRPTGKRHCLNGVSLVFKPA